MLNTKSYELVDATLQDIMGQAGLALEKLPFGGKLVVFGGDMRQVLPNVKKGSRAAIVDARINKSPFWPDVTCLKLTINKWAEILLGTYLKRNTYQLRHQNEHLHDHLCII